MMPPPSLLPSPAVGWRWAILSLGWLNEGKAGLTLANHLYRPCRDFPSCSSSCHAEKQRNPETNPRTASQGSCQVTVAGLGSPLL